MELNAAHDLHSCNLQGALSQEQARTQKLKQQLTSLEAEYHATLDRMSMLSQPTTPERWSRKPTSRFSY